MQGFLNLNKPAGLTSHDCVARVRRLLKLKRVGHGGTLDPAATGVLPIALGTATRLLQFLASDKAYRATIRFGMVTATDDLAGEVLHQAAVAELDRTMVESYLPRFLGSIQQVPPRYSAIQVQGKRLYDLARAGEVVEVPVRTVEIYSIEICDWRPGAFPELDVEIACGAGTYIRSIARDWGAALGSGGTLAALTRTRSSGFNLQDSVALDELRDQIEQNAFAAIAPDLALRHLPTVTLPDETAWRWCQGQKIIGTESGGLYRIQDATETLLGIAESIESEAGWLLRQRVVLAQSAADSKA